MHSPLTRRQALTALGTAAATAFRGGQISAAEAKNEPLLAIDPGSAFRPLALSLVIRISAL